MLLALQFCGGIASGFFIPLTLSFILRGIQPRREVGSVAGLDALVDLAHRLLDANKNRIGHVTTGLARRGAEHWVYGRGGLQCRRCGTIISRADQGPGAEARVTFWCPSCQR